MAGQVALNLQALTFNDHPLWELTCGGKKRGNVILLNLSQKLTIL